MNTNIKTVDGHSITIVYEKSDVNANNTLTILTHGIFTDKHEKGRFDKLSKRFLDAGSDVLRFDFRGHGESDLSPEHFTVTGALIDFVTVCKSPIVESYNKVAIVGSSFGASIVLLYLGTLNQINIDKLVLLNPVVDYSRTFTQADLEWGQSMFSKNVTENFYLDGYAMVTDKFRMSLDCFSQLLLIRPYDFINEIDIPTIVFHGDKDDKVSCKISIDNFKGKELVSLDVVNGAGHAFKTPEHEKYVHNASVGWVMND